MQSGSEDVHEVSHAGIFRSPRAATSFLTRLAEPQVSPRTLSQGMETQSTTLSKSYHESRKGRFATKRGWLSEVYVTGESPCTEPIPEPPPIAHVPKAAPLLGHTKPINGPSFLPSRCVHHEPTPRREPPQEKWQPLERPHVSEEKGQPQGTNSPMHLPPATSVDTTLEEQIRDEQIKAVKEALLKSEGFLSNKLRSASQAPAHSIGFSPPARKKSLKRRSERTASLQRRKNSAFGEIREADREMCDLAQDLMSVIDDEVNEKTKVDEKTEINHIQESARAPVCSTSLDEAPLCSPRMGDRVYESIGELRGLEHDVGQLTKDLRALKQLLQGSK